MSGRFGITRPQKGDKVQQKTCKICSFGLPDRLLRHLTNITAWLHAALRKRRRSRSPPATARPSPPSLLQKTPDTGTLRRRCREQKGAAGTGAGRATISLLFPARDLPRAAPAPGGGRETCHHPDAFQALAGGVALLPDGALLPAWLVAPWDKYCGRASLISSESAACLHEGFCTGGEQKPSPGEGRGRAACPGAAMRSDGTTPSPGGTWVPEGARDIFSDLFISFAVDSCRPPGSSCRELGRALLSH